jgi:predicted nucleic acid-binding protein
LSSRYVLDSWALIALLNKEPPASAEVESLLQKAADGQAFLALSIINLGEIYYIVGRSHGSQAADSFLERIKRLPIQIMQADEPRVLAAARLKMNHAISYADAFAAAAALELEAVLLTGDPELVQLSDIIEIQKLNREG